MKKRIWIVFAVMALLMTGLLSFSQVKAENVIGKYNPPRSLSVTGNGVIKASPDMARVVLGYVNEEKEARTSQENNAKIANELIRVLKESGIEDKDLQTVEFSINPIYTYYPDKEPVIRGYQTVHMLSVAIRKLDKIGTTIDIATKAGANRFQNISFDIADRESYKLQAIELAMKDAHKKAETALKPEGEQIMQIVTVSVDGGWVQSSPSYRNDLKEGAAPAPSIQAGELTIQINVQCTYSF